MKKAAILLTAVLLAACASTPTVTSLTKAQCQKMNKQQVVDYYKAENQKMLDRVLYESGGIAYEKCKPVVDRTNYTLDALVRKEMDRPTFENTVNHIMYTNEQKIKYALKEAAAQ